MIRSARVRSEDLQRRWSPARLVGVGRLPVFQGAFPMKKATFLVVVLLAGLPAAGCHRTGRSEAAVEVIQKLGGKMQTDDALPDKPVVMVDLRNTAVSDDQLKCLKQLPELRVLVLDGTEVGDGGLEALKQ